MIKINLTTAELDLLHKEAMENTSQDMRTKCLVIYLKGMGYKHQEIARILRIDLDTVTNYVKAYAQGGLAAFHENHYRQPQSCLAPYQELITKRLQENPPHSISKACQMIEECTGIRLKNSACREFLKKLGLKFRRVGMIPSGACPATQRDFHENE